MRIPYPPKVEDAELAKWLEWLVEELQKPTFEACNIGIDTTNYTEIQADGDIVCHGTATITSA